MGTDLTVVNAARVSFDKASTTTTENIMKQLLEAIKVKFEIRLQEKTGWGRNEIIRAYNDCVTEALLEHLG